MMDEKKSKRQQLVVENFIRNKTYRHYFLAQTGFGKSMVAIILIQMFNAKNINTLINIVVPTDKLKDDWNNHIKNHNLVNCKVFVVNTYIKSKQSCGFLIMDECHWYSGTKAKYFNKVIDNTNNGNTIPIFAMSATLTQEEQRFLINKGLTKCDEVTLEECLEQGYTSPYYIFNIGLDLSAYDKMIYDDWTKKFNHLMGQFKDIDTAISCVGTVSPRYFNNQWNYPPQVLIAVENGWIAPPIDYFVDIWKQNKAIKDYNATVHKRNLKKKVIPYFTDVNKEDYWHPQNISLRAIQFNQLLQKRKFFLHNTESKNHFVDKIIAEFPAPTLIFSESTTFADTIAERINGVSCHSKKTKKENTTNFNKFVNGETNYLCSATMYDEGIDIPNLTQAIICGRTSTDRKLRQRIGRCNRLDYNNLNKIGILWNVYIKDSQDEKWLLKSLKGIKYNVYWIETIQQAKQILEKQKQLL